MVKHYVKLLSPSDTISRKGVRNGRKFLPGFLILFFLMGLNISSGQLIAGWDFQTSPGTVAASAPSAPTVYASNFGSGNLYLNGTNGSSTWVTTTANNELTSFGGTAVNAGSGFSTVTSGQSALAIVGGASSGTAANGKSMVFTFSMTGKQNLIVTYATQRTTTGFNSQTWEYSTTGLAGSWTTVESKIPASSYSVQTVATITGLNNAATAYLRMTVTGASASAGNNRLDNIQLNASALTSTPSLAITGTPVNFGTVCSNTPSSVNYTITNSGTVAASDVQVVSTNPTEYAVSNFTQNSTIGANGGTATYTITFTPSATGTRTATINVTSSTSGSNAPSSSLTGTGLLPLTQAVTSDDASDVGPTFATLNGDVGTLGVCPSSTVRGFVYSKTSDDNDPEVGDSNVTASSIAAATGNFSLPLTGLPNGTEYAYKAYIYNGTTYAYGDLKTFTTTTPPVNDMCSSPNSLSIGVTGTGQTLVEATADFDTTNDVWYTFTPDCSGTHSILVNFTEGEDIDFEVYASTCPTSSSEKLTLTNSNAGFDFKSADFQAEVGTTYYLRVLDAGGNSTVFSLLVDTAVTPLISLSNTVTPPSGNIAAGTNNVVLFGFSLTPSDCNSSFTFSGADIYQINTNADTSDLSNFRLITDADANGIADSGEISAAIGTVGLIAGHLDFTSLAQTLPGGTTSRYLLIADVNSGAVNGRTFQASLDETDVDSNVTVSGVSVGEEYSITSTSITIADNAQVTALTASNSIGQIIIAKAKLTVNGQSATVTNMDFVTAGFAGGYTQSNIAANGFKLWRTSSASIFDTNTPLGSVSSTKVTATDTETLSFTTSQNLAVGDHYYWLTLDVAPAGAPTYSVMVNGLTNTSVTSAGATILGSSSVAGVQTITSPSLIVADNTIVPAGNILLGTNDSIIARAELSSDSINLTAVSFTTSGNASGYTTADIEGNGFKLWISNTNDFGTATLFGTAQSSTKAIATNTETITFTDSQNLPGISTHYLWLTVTTSNSATPGKIIGVNGLSYTDITTSTAGVFALGNSSNSGNQTIVSTSPSLTTASASVDNPFSITLSPDNANYRGAITNVKIGTTDLVFTTSAGNITLDPADPGNVLLRTPGNKIIDITATNYTAAQVTQTMTVGAAAKLALGLPALAPPTTNGGLFATQPTISYRDKYDNSTTSTETITVTKLDGGSWTLGGTTSITPGAPTDSIVFTNLTATSAALVSNAQLLFSLPNVSGSTSVNSATFTILAPDFISLSAFGTTVSENFDTLATSGTSSATPTGWLLLETGSGANATYNANAGALNGGDTYSYGTGTATDRAFGTLLSGSVTSTIGAKFKNTTGGNINSLTITYTGEQWRLGQSGRGADRLDFEYSTDATSLTTGTWAAVTALNFSSPIITGTVGALDGNASANRTVITHSISSLDIADGATFFIRYKEFNVSGSDDGLAVDNFNITPCQAPNAGTNGTLTVCAGTTPTNAELFAQLGGSPQAGGTWSGPVSGVYTYTVNSTAPCTGNATATVTVTTQAAANAGTDGVYTICSGTDITLEQLQAAITGEDAGGTWSPALGGAGTYTYTVAATSPCTAPDTSVVVVSAVSCQATQLSNCGSIPALPSVNTRIFAANTITTAQTYRYRVAVSTAPTTYFYAVTTYPSFRLTDVVGLVPTYGTTYTVEIQNEFLLSGNTVTSAYGPMCTVSTQAATNITVATNQCNQTLAAVNSKIYVNGVTGATMYTYRIAKQSAPSQYGYIETPYSNFRLTAPLTSGSVAIEHNTVYLVAVSVTTANGSSNFNGECLITTPAGPVTTIQASQCGDDETPYQIATSSTKVYAADFVSGATYTFRLEEYDGSTLLDTNEVTSPINYFDTNMFTGSNALKPNTNYHVYVAINYYGTAGFDHDCVVRTPGALKNDQMSNDFKAVAYPNPFANNFMIDVKSSSESSVNLKVYDMIGRLIEQRDVRMSDLEATTIGDRYPSGVYNVVVSQESSVQTVRVVKR